MIGNHRALSRRDFRLIEYDELYSFPDTGLDGVVSEVRHAGVAEAEAVDVLLEPNPARGRVGVKSTVGMTGLSVYNVQGALVERQEARGMQAEIDVTGWQ